MVGDHDELVQAGAVPPITHGHPFCGSVILTPRILTKGATRSRAILHGWQRTFGASKNWRSNVSIDRTSPKDIGTVTVVFERQKRGGDFAGGVRRSEKSRLSEANSNPASRSMDKASGERIAAMAEAQIAAQGPQVDICDPRSWSAQVETAKASATTAMLCGSAWGACVGAALAMPKTATSTAKISESRARSIA